ncbi:MAG: guanylate kinase [Clostridia bacterium]
MNKGTFFVLSGPSGSGKGTVLKEVLNKNSDIEYSVSATTRLPRGNEIEGKNYFFKTRDEFEKLIKQDAFLEYTETFGNYYGTLRKQVDLAIERGHSIILEIDSVGARNIRFSYPDAVLMFLVAPSLTVLKARLTGRGTEKDDDVKLRLANAIDEMEYAPLYDYIIINDNVGKASEDVLAIIKAVGLKTENNIENLTKIKGGISL